MNTKTLKKIALCTFIILICVASFFLLGDKFSDSNKYSSLSSTIDKQIASVQKLSVMSTVTSTAISAIPDDTATPVAEKLADFTEYFLVILCILYLEKYAMPLIVGLGIFKIIIPILGVFLIIAIIKESKSILSLCAKIALISVAFTLVIPISVGASDKIYSACGETVDSLVTESEQLSSDANEISEASSAGKLIGAVTQAVKTIVNKASSIITKLLETTAVMIVASCAIPILIILLFSWLINIIIGKDTIRIINQGSVLRKE